MFRLYLLFVFAMCLGSCTKKYQPSRSPALLATGSTTPDYSRMDFWAAHPNKKDPSDSIPSPLLNEKRDSLVDVFFIHPTTYTDTRIGWNADLNDDALNSKTDYSSILYQASVFNQHARVFAPRYRQAHLSSFYANDKTATEAFDTAYSDLKRAFEFFLKNNLEIRPIIIAGHSQGAKMSIRLLQEFFDNQPLQHRLVAAYIVGWPVAQNSFKNILVCKDSLQTNCFCTWRTFRQGYLPDYVEKEPSQSYVTNPLSWKVTDEYVSRDHNYGSILRDFHEIVPKTTDAQVQGGVLWANRPRFPGSIFFTTKNYHIGDINLFYMNLRRNIEQRILSYINNK